MTSGTPDVSAPTHLAKPSFADGWNRFFFSETRADALALARILLCAALLVPVASRWHQAREIYSTDGVATPMAACYANPIDYPVLGGGATVVAYTALVFCLFTGMIGWYTRTSLAIAAVLLIHFGMLDYVGTLTKYTVIGMHGLGILAFANAGVAWSVDAALAGDVTGARVRIAAWPLRVIQLFLAILYFATAITKIKTPEFMTGEHTIFWMQTNMNFAHPLGYWISTRPELVIISSYLVVIWEALFPALCWNRTTLRPLLAIGAIFHALTYLLIGLAIFPWIVMAFYPAFLSGDRARSLMLRISRSIPTINTLPPLRWAGYAWAFPLILGLTIVTAVEAEYHIDPMGLRDTMPALPMISHDVAVERLTDSSPARTGDFVWRVDLGESAFAGVVQNSSRTFSATDAPLVQVWANNPHPDLFVYLDIVDDSESVLIQDGLVIARGEHRASRALNLGGNLTPGNYAVIVRDDVGMIARRSFRVTD